MNCWYDVAVQMLRYLQRERKIQQKDEKKSLRETKEEKQIEVSKEMQPTHGAVKK